MPVLILIYFRLWTARLEQLGNWSVKYLILVQRFQVWQKKRRRRRRTGQLRLYLVTEFTRENFRTSDPEKTHPNSFSNISDLCVFYIIHAWLLYWTCFVSKGIYTYLLPMCNFYTWFSWNCCRTRCSRAGDSLIYTVSGVFLFAILNNSGIMGCCGSTQVRDHETKHRVNACRFTSGNFLELNDHTHGKKLRVQTYHILRSIICKYLVNGVLWKRRSVHFI